MADLYSKVYFGNKIIDANQASLSIASSAVLYGLSVYTVFPVSINDKGEVVVFRLEDHFKRLTDSAKIIGMDRFGEEWHLDSFTDAVQELILANDIRSNVFARAPTSWPARGRRWPT